MAPFPGQRQSFFVSVALLLRVPETAQTPPAYLQSGGKQRGNLRRGWTTPDFMHILKMWESFKSGMRKHVWRKVRTLLLKLCQKTTGRFGGITLYPPRCPCSLSLCTWVQLTLTAELFITATATSSGAAEGTATANARHVNESRKNFPQNCEERERHNVIYLIWKLRQTNTKYKVDQLSFTP